MKRKVLCLLTVGLLILIIPTACGKRDNRQETAGQKVITTIEEQYKNEEAKSEVAEQEARERKQREKEEARLAAEQKKTKELCQSINNAVANHPTNLSIQEIDAINKLFDKNNPTSRTQWVVDSLIQSGANCLDENAGWVDAEKGQMIYDILKRYDGNFVSDRLVKNVLNYENRLQVLFLVVKLVSKARKKNLVMHLCSMPM